MSAKDSEDARQDRTSYEILARPVAPGIANVPYVQQGFFLQISNLAAKTQEIAIEYIGSPTFVAASAADKLFANIIDETGTPNQYPTMEFMAGMPGFKTQLIPPQTTWLFGVQYLLLPPPAPILTPATGGTPQDSVEARGVIRLESLAGSSFLFLATVRQVFNNYDNAGNLLDVAEGAYAVPLLAGPEQNF